MPHDYQVFVSYIDLFIRFSASIIKVSFSDKICANTQAERRITKTARPDGGKTVKRYGITRDISDDENSRGNYSFDASSMSFGCSKLRVKYE